MVKLGSQRSEAGVQIKLRYFNTSFGECEVAVLKESTSPTELHVNSAGGIEGAWGIIANGIGCGRRSISGVKRLKSWRDDEVVKGVGARSLNFNVPCPTTASLAGYKRPTF